MKRLTLLAVLAISFIGSVSYAHREGNYELGAEPSDEAGSTDLNGCFECNRFNMRNPAFNQTSPYGVSLQMTTEHHLPETQSTTAE